MIARWPALYVIVVVGIVITYRFGPDREHVQWRWITWGSGLAAALWIVVSIVFSWYAANFGAYNKTYGSLGRRHRLHDLDVDLLHGDPRRSRS